MLFLNYQIGREDKIICNFKTIILKSVLINGAKNKGMKLKKKIGKKIATLTFAAAMAAGGSLSIFAATGFTVSDPLLSYFNNGYFIADLPCYSEFDEEGIFRDLAGSDDKNNCDRIYRKGRYT